MRSFFRDFDFRFAEEQGITIVGGSSNTVGASGGWIGGGGHSAVSNTLGLGVDRAVRAVTLFQALPIADTEKLPASIQGRHSRRGLPHCLVVFTPGPILCTSGYTTQPLSNSFFLMSPISLFTPRRWRRVNVWSGHGVDYYCGPQAHSSGGLGLFLLL